MGCHSIADDSHAGLVDVGFPPGLGAVSLVELAVPSELPLRNCSPEWVQQFVSVMARGFRCGDGSRSMVLCVGAERQRAAARADLQLAEAEAARALARLDEAEALLERAASDLLLANLEVSNAGDALLRNSLASAGH